MIKVPGSHVRRGGIGAVVAMHWEAVSRGDLAGEVVFWANAVRIRGGNALDEVLAEQVSAIVEAPEPTERAVLQPDRAKFLEQPAAHLLWRQSLRTGAGLLASQIEIASASAAPAGTNLRVVRTSSIESS